MPHSGQTGIYFDSGGYRLLGRLFLAPGDQPKPTALLLHGLPGIEQNYDLAFALREHGWNAVIFHYRGCWGSAGVYNFTTLPGDVRACLDYLDTGAHPQVDPARLVLVGHSMGGWAGVLAASADARPVALALIGAVVAPGLLHFDDPAMMCAEFVPWLPGLTETEFAAGWRALGSDPCWNAAEQVGQIAPRPLLIVHAEHDDVSPLAQAHMLYEAAREPRRLITHPDANHSFTAHRPWLREQIITWLDDLHLQA